MNKYGSCSECIKMFGISGANAGYIYTCNTRIGLEDLIVRILTSKRMVAVIQELIRVNQAKKTAVNFDEMNNNEETVQNEE